MAIVVSMTSSFLLPLEAAVSALSYKQSGRFQLTAGKDPALPFGDEIEASSRICKRADQLS
jgi:hypothetical protein